jgi:NTE family protein
MVLSYEQFPDLVIADAVRASMSIPLYYCAVFMDSTGRFYSRPPRTIPADVLVDGGLLMNYPIGLFDKNRFLSTPQPNTAPDASIFNAETLGLRLESAEQIKADAQNMGLAPYPIRSFKTYMGAFYNLISEAANRYSLRPEDLKRTISVDFQNIGGKVRKLTEAEKNVLIESGKKCVGEFCKPASAATNLSQN